MESIAYTYRNAPIPGGGYVTGFLYHPNVQGVLYCRTDIGGVYRFDGGRWVSLMDHVTGEAFAESFPIALAADPEDANTLYIVSGILEEGYGILSISHDQGESFTYRTVPTPVHGNLSGRGTGDRLVARGTRLWFASQLGGLWSSHDLGSCWQRLPLPEDYTTFIWVSPDETTLVCGTAGYTTRVHDTLRGHSLYVSYDGGQSFEKLPMPENILIPDSKMNGLVASRCCFDGDYLYITLNSTGRFNYIVPLGYSCDTGDVIGGRVIRYPWREGRLGPWEDITPGGESWLNYGFGGISTCKALPGLLVCSTLCREKEAPEAVYLSYDRGGHWRTSLEGLTTGGIHFRTSYMKPEYNGCVSLLHWLSDVKLDPFDPNKLWFNSGTGVFTTDALLSENPAYHDFCDGIEETVHLNVYAPVSGDVQLVDIVGDLGGFAFRQLDKPCENSFADGEGNRYITCINADLSELQPELGIVTARGNWKGKTKGGLILTEDQFRSFRRLPMPYQLGGDLERQLRVIEQPNVNPGWVAMSPDGQSIVWSVADGIRLPIHWVIASRDGGAHFERVQVTDLQGKPVTQGCLKVFSDRERSDLFYGFGERGQVYLSTDGGLTYRQKPTALPEADFGLIDCANKTEVRGVESGVFYIALGNLGLWKLLWCGDRFTAVRLTASGDSCLRCGLGLGRPGGDYRTEPKALYLCGSIGGVYGFYRTSDEGKTLIRLNTGKQMYGQINSIEGDKRVFGRFYIATGSRGVLYGEEAT